MLLAIVLSVTVHLAATVACPAGEWLPQFFRATGPDSIDEPVWDFLPTGNGVVVIGSFTEAGGVPVEYVARWDGMNWHAMGALPNQSKRALESYGGAVIALVDSTLYSWNGVEWSPYAGGRPSPGLRMSSLGLHDGNLVVIARTDDWIGNCAGESVWLWDGGTWTEIPYPAPWGFCNSLDVISLGDVLFVAGRFLSGHDPTSWGVVAWDGMGWTRVGTDARPFRVTDLEVYNGELIAAASSWSNSLSQGVLRWGGDTWEELGSIGDTDDHLRLAVYRDVLISAFRNPLTPNRNGYGVVDMPLRFDGSVWCPLGAYLENANGQNPISVMRGVGDELFVGGSLYDQNGSKDGMAVWRDDLLTATPSPTTVSLRIDRAIPNPASGGTRVGFRLGHAGVTRVSVFDARGRLVRILREGWLSAGDHAVDWDGRDASGTGVASGVYHIRVSALGEVRSKPVAILE